MRIVTVTCGNCHGESYRNGLPCTACSCTGYVLAREVSPAVFVEADGREVDVVDLANACWGEE